MLGDIFGRSAGLTCDVLLRFLLLACTLQSARATTLLSGDVAEATAGLGGTESARGPPVASVAAFRADMVGVVCELICVSNGCKLGVLASLRAGSGNVKSFRG